MVSFIIAILSRYPSLARPDLRWGLNLYHLSIKTTVRPSTKLVMANLHPIMADPHSNA
jgi:hypothetical protein